MGIYIKDMDMPRSCDICPFRYENRLSYHEYCTVNEQRIWEDKPDWCPLIFIEDKDETEDVAPVIHAYWIPPAYPYPWYKAKCSNCGVEDGTSFGGILNEGSWNQKIWKPIYKYCPNCGAKMDDE